ncbi:coiled-coil domain-containing protein 146 [Megalops cyprinoides]|uniref:coiled-coil domain-containing protein 146 n=1 Tax=Megalops cyprinoides TaxID=118141 RepID=UPI001863DC4B|nr:coiled-coil domain-containing protein 146 [Megalops cyprinoides]
MSDTSDSEGSSHPSEAEEQTAEEKAIAALAPFAGVEEEGQTQFSSSPAFECLDQLLAAGKISKARAAELKASFTLLLDTLKSSQQSEIQLLQEGRRLAVELDRQQRELEKAERFPEGTDTEVGKMRLKLLHFQNSIREAEEKEYQLQFQLECLQGEKDVLQKEYETQPKPVEMEKKAKALKDRCEELRKEIAQRRMETKSLGEDSDMRQKQLEREQRELDDKNQIIHIHEAELAALLSVPGHLGKESDRIKRKRTDVEKKMAELDQQLAEISDLNKKAEARKEALEEERKEVQSELEARRVELEVAEREHNRLLKEKDSIKEKEAIMMGQSGMLDINISHITVERKTLQDSLARNQKERERQTQSMKTMELKLKLATDALTDTQLHYNKLKAQMEALPQGDEVLQRRNELQKEVEYLRRNLMQQQALTEAETRVVEQCLEQEQELLRESHRCREELRHDTCLAQIKADEKEQKSHELLIAEQRLGRIKEELKGKSLVILDYKKENQEVQARLTVFAKLYEGIKAERSKCVNLIQLATQRASEMREEFEILENEIEILRTSAINKDKLLQKSRLKRVHSECIRDTLKKDMSKMNHTLQEMRDKRAEQNLNIGKLTNMINMYEENLLQLRKSYERAVQSRNDRGVQLLERENEMCIFYEKVNVQEGMIQEGNMEIHTMEEEVKLLKMLISEEKREIELARKLMPIKRALEGEINTLQKQLSDCKDRRLELEKAVEDQQSRSRRLEGKDQPPEELIKKIEQLEEGLAEREAKLLEKELVYDQVTQLSERIRAKAENGKKDTLELAKKVGEIQNQIEETTRKMMSVVSELSMEQAKAMTLQQEVQEKEATLDSCQRRLEQGMPPSEDMELEWQRTLTNEQRQQADAQERARRAEEQEKSQLPGGGVTTAEARPNAYIPEEDNLPIPRPYGALAPFKPSELGTNLRHIRKPQPKPIEI